jgi:hypothetical protein
LVDLPGKCLRPPEVAPREIVRLERRVFGERREDVDRLRVALFQDEDLSERVLGLAKVRVGFQCPADVVFGIGEAAIRV